MTTTIETVHGREILDSRGFPTVEATVTTADGAAGTAAVPSGASTGEREAIELRDGDPRRYRGKGVLKAVGNVNGVLAPALRGLDAADQARVDAKLVALDGTENKGRLGATRCSPSPSPARARRPPRWHAALPLARRCARDAPPVPLMNVVNGGRHAATRSTSRSS